MPTPRFARAVAGFPLPRRLRGNDSGWVGLSGVRYNVLGLPLGADLSGRVSFEPVGEADAGLLLEMMRAFHQEEGRVRGMAGEAAVAAIAGGEPLARAWIAWRADRTVGYVVIRLGYSIEYGGRDGFIDDLYVVPGQGGQGLGRAMLGSRWRRRWSLGSGRCIWKWRRRGTRRRTGFIGRRVSRRPAAS